jgi:replication fork protection complex subunit Tof1/Swi1
MFANAKLRLLLNEVGLEKLGVEDVPGASWVVPARMGSTELREAVSTLNKSMLNPIPEGSTEDPREQLRRKNTGSARDNLDQGTLDINFGDDSEGEDVVPEGILFPPNPRSKSNALDELKKKRKSKKKDNSEKEPLGDDVLEARRDARLSNALARQAKIKSDLFIHASDEESDADGDAEFFRLEEERRKKQAENVKKALLTGRLEEDGSKGKKASARKRKSDTGKSAATGEPKRQRRGSESGGSDAGSDDDDILMADLEGESSRSREVDTGNATRDDEDTPLTSAEDEDELDFDDDLVFARDRKSKADAPETNVDEDEEDTPVVSSRRMRGGFVIESDSE